MNIVRRVLTGLRPAEGWRGVPAKYKLLIHGAGDTGAVGLKPLSPPLLGWPALPDRLARMGQPPARHGALLQLAQLVMMGLILFIGWKVYHGGADKSLPPMTVEPFLTEAARLARQDFRPSVPVPIAALDPPLNGELNGPGLVFEEYNAVSGDKYYDDKIFALEARPRGNVQRQPLDIDDRNASPARTVPYRLDQYDYSAPEIRPALRRVPLEGQYLAGLRVIHRVPDAIDSFPIMLVVNGDGFLRLTGEPPRTFGTSYRVATHNVGAALSNGDPFDEDFPRIVKVATEVLDADRVRLSFLVDTEAFTGVLVGELTPGVESTMDVKATFTMRRDLRQGQEMNTGFAGLSSLFFQGKRETPKDRTDQAHDADVLAVTYSDGSTADFPLLNPATPFKLDFQAPAGQTLKSFALEQRDRVAAHYARFANADYAARSSLAIEDINASIPLKVTLQIFPTSSEYFDNVVAHLTLLDDLKKGDVVTVNYRLRAY